MITINQRLGYITKTLARKGKGGRLAKVVAAYFGFNSASEAIAAANEIRRQFPKARIEVRPSQRLQTTHELKISHKAIEAIIQNFIKLLETTSQRVVKHLQVVKSRPSIQPDSPSRRYSNAPATPRHTGRTMVAMSDGHLIGID
jgi:prepilin-type processing-associated H-X9-DG protein